MGKVVLSGRMPNWGMVLILVLVDLGGKGTVLQCLVSQDTNSLNPCFGGFGWERTASMDTSSPLLTVLILVLVDLGGKVENRTVLQCLVCLNPCFGGFGWERLNKTITFCLTKGCLNPCFGGFGWERLRFCQLTKTEYQS